MFAAELKFNIPEDILLIIVFYSGNTSFCLLKEISVKQTAINVGKPTYLCKSSFKPILNNLDLSETPFDIIMYGLYSNRTLP